MNRIHHFKRVQVARSLGLSSSANTLYAESTTFGGNVNTPADFTGLYDQYRINKIIYGIRLRLDPTAQSATNAFFPKMYIAADYDDALTPPSLSNLAERGNIRQFVLKPDREYKFKFTPAVASATYQTATSTGYAPKWKQWIDMADQNVPHYGMKLGIEQMPALGFYIEITTNVYFSCKGVI